VSFGSNQCKPFSETRIVSAIRRNVGRFIGGAGSHDQSTGLIKRHIDSLAIASFRSGIVPGTIPRCCQSAKPDRVQPQ
jgi:hypothetical protein